MKTQLPAKLAPLALPKRFKVIYGGRDGAKSWSIARQLLLDGTLRVERILCVREIQKTITDSVHKLLTDQIKAMGLQDFYMVRDTSITGKNGTEFMFAGLHQQTADNLKSYEGVTKCWAEEAHRITKRSWGILIPTIRAAGSEIWVSFNPDMDTDDTYVRFVVDPPDDAVVIKMTWRDNPWYSTALDSDRRKMQRDDPQEYEHIYEGKCNTVVPGAIYASEVIDLIESGRFRNVPYDPQLKVHRIWDMGWNDSMSIIFAQRLQSEVRIIDYIEDDHRLLTDYLAECESGHRRRWVWGKDWLPHDGGQARHQTGKSDAEVIIKLRGPNMVNVAPRKTPELGIRAARMLFPRVYIDKSDREPPQGMGGFRGPARLVDCLKRYKRSIPVTTMEPGAPVHDEYSHGADAWRELALRVDQMTNDDQPKPRMQEEYQQAVRGVM